MCPIHVCTARAYIPWPYVTYNLFIPRYPTLVTPTHTRSYTHDMCTVTTDNREHKSQLQHELALCIPPSASYLSSGGTLDMPPSSGMPQMLPCRSSPVNMYGFHHSSVYSPSPAHCWEIGWEGKNEVEGSCEGEPLDQTCCTPSCVVGGCSV